MSIRYGTITGKTRDEVYVLPGPDGDDGVCYALVTIDRKEFQDADVDPVRGLPVSYRPAKDPNRAHLTGARILAWKEIHLEEPCPVL